MKNLIINYIKNLEIHEVNNFAIKNNVFLSKSELLFIFNFIKTNYEEIFSTNFNLSKYKEKLSAENFPKIDKLLNLYRSKYQSYLS